MFRGCFITAVGRDGRLILPARFREVLAMEGAAQLVLVRSPSADERHVVGLPLGAWRRAEAQLAAETADPAEQATVQAFVASARVVRVDARGRVRIPAALRAWAGIAGVATLVGDVDRVGLWNAEAWERHVEREARTRSGDA